MVAGLSPILTMMDISAHLKRAGIQLSFEIKLF